MTTDETENLLEPSEENINYWTQKCLDAIEGERFYADAIRKVIRELLTADTHYSTMKWCECGHPLSQCGTPSVDGEPTLDCRVCQLKAELSVARTAAVFATERAEAAERERDDADRNAKKIEAECNQWHAESMLLVESNASLRAEVEAAHAVLDNDPSKIIRNAKDGYPEGREARVLTLADRVQALCRYAADYKRWLDEKEAQLAKRQWVSVSERMPEPTPSQVIFFVTPTGYGFCPSRFFGIDPRNGSTATQWFALPPTQEPATVETCPTCGESHEEANKRKTPKCFARFHDNPTPDPLADSNADLWDQAIDANVGAFAVQHPELAPKANPLACGGKCKHDGENCRSPKEGYVCTLEIGHTGPHIACGTEDGEHAYLQWENPDDLAPAPASPPKVERVALEAKDVPPGSAFMDSKGDWFITENKTGPWYGNFRTCVSLEQAFIDGWQIKRPGEDWQPCSKEASHE